MTVNNQNLLEFAGMETKALQTSLGFWSVTTMFEVGKLVQLTRETGQYKLNILGVWTGLGSLKAIKRETVLFSGHENFCHHENVAMILHSGVKNHYLNGNQSVVK